MEGEFRPLTDHIEQPSERLRNRAEWAITHAATTTHARQEIAIYKPIPVIRSRRIGLTRRNRWQCADLGWRIDRQNRSL